MLTNNYWEAEIDDFWKAVKKTFHKPYKSKKCGSHIHVSPGPDKCWDGTELQGIAFGVIFYEPLVKAILPRHRQENTYCRPNSEASEELRGCYQGGELNLARVWRLMGKQVNSREGLRDLMQGGGSQHTRHALWNFSNIVSGKSGTIEFRGASGFRDSASTRRWVSFVVAFIHLCLSKV